MKFVQRLLLTALFIASVVFAALPMPTTGATVLTETTAKIAVTAMANTYSEASSPLPDDAAPLRYEYTEREVEMLAKTVWGEAGICSEEEQRLVIWTVLQRVDDERFPDTIEEVLTAPDQFHGYREDNPIDADIRVLCEAELADWMSGAEAPTLDPYAASSPFLFFDGDGTHNWFREGWR